MTMLPLYSFKPGTKPTKHVEIDLHFGREHVAFGHARVLHIPSTYQFVDIFTKSLLSQLFLDFRSCLSIQEPSASTAEGVLESDDIQ